MLFFSFVSKGDSTHAADGVERAGEKETGRGEKVREREMLYALAFLNFIQTDCKDPKEGEAMFVSFVFSPRRREGEEFAFAD
jgi:hypothetical protein